MRKLIERITRLETAIAAAPARSDVFSPAGIEKARKLLGKLQALASETVTPEQAKRDRATWRSMAADPSTSIALQRIAAIGLAMEAQP